MKIVKYHIVLLILLSVQLSFAQNIEIPVPKAAPDNEIPLEDSKSLANAYFKKGITESMAFQNYELGIESFSKSIEIDPENALAYYNRSFAFMKLEKYDKAIEDLKTSIEKDPSNKKAYLNLGKCYTMVDDHDKAIEVYNLAIKIDSNYAPIYYNLGICLSKTGNTSDALSAYNTATRLSPDNQIYYFNRALLKQSVSQLSGALSDFEMAEKIDPNNANIHFAKGFVYLNQNDEASALLAFSKAIQIDPNFWDAYFNRGLVLLEFLDFQKASNDLDLFCKNVTNDPLAYFYAGKAKMELGENYEAMQYFQRSVDLNPEFGWSNYYLGYIMINSYGKFEGCDYLKRAFDQGIDEAEKTLRLACIK